MWTTLGQQRNENCKGGIFSLVDDLKSVIPCLEKNGQEKESHEQGYNDMIGPCLRCVAAVRQQIVTVYKNTISSKYKWLNIFKSASHIQHDTNT